LKRKDNVGKKNYHMVKNITNEIVLLLSGNNLHTRALAKELNTNHVTVINKLGSLMEENVVDFKQKGKNKVYFLKKSVEARNYVIMAELYKLNNVIRIYPTLRKIIEAIKRHSKITLAILFGSYAKGIAKRDSDIDIFIETRDRNLKKELQLLNSKLSVKIGNYNRANLLIKEIEKNHVIIKGVELYYEKAKSI
jgi:predicted nucleotidyltransferase